MIDFGDGPSSEERGSQALPIRDVLLAAHNSEKRAIPDPPGSIDISYLYSYCEGLRENTKREQVEYSQVAVLTKFNNNRMRMTDPPIPGFLDQEARFVVERMRDNFLTRNGLVLLPIHTHPFDAPQSPLDISYLFEITNNEVGIHGKEVGTMVIAPSETTLIMRGSRTPLWDNDKIDQQVELWERTMRERTAVQEDPLEQPQITNPKIKPWQIHKLIRAASKEMLETERGNKSHKKASYASMIAAADVTREIAREYDLKWYSGPSDARVLTLQPL